MRRRQYVLNFLGLSCALLVCAPTVAQQSESTDGTREAISEAETAENRPSIREVQPKLFYLRNEKGDLIYVPDFSFERWEQLVRIARNLSDPEQPDYVIQEMNVTGAVREQWIDLDILFNVRRRAATNSDRSGHLRVPLRLNDAVLREAPEFEGPGEYFLTYDETQDGYECWIRSAEDTAHDVRLSVSVPVKEVGGESHFRLHAPMPLASQITFEVPEEMAEGSLENLVDSTSRPLTFEQTAGGQGQFSTRGIRGNVLLRWHKTRPTATASTTQLDVFGSIVVTANELSQEVRSEGRFVVRGFGGPVEKFRVRLPPGMRFRQSPEPGYKVEPVTGAEARPEEGQLVEIQLDRPAAHESHVQLIAELPAEPGDSEWPVTTENLVDRPIQLQPTRFNFLGAVRHRGRIDFVVKGDWSLQWNEDPNVPRVELNGSGRLDRELVSRFRYFSQPSNLKVAVQQKATRISVEPTYGLYVDSQHVRIKMGLACRTSGSKAGPVALGLRGWTVETLDLGDRSSSLPVDLTDNDPLIIPIPSEAQSAGRFTIQIEARRSLTAGVVSGTEPLRVVLPQVQAANPSHTNLIVSPASITVTSAQDVALTPRPRDMQALAPLVAPSGTLDNAPQANVFRYRDRGAVESASFVSDFEIQSRSLTASVTSVAELDTRQLRVEQWFSYTILHEGVDSLLLSVPETLVQEDRVQFRSLLDDQPLKLTVDRRIADKRFLVSAQLPQKILGNVELRLIHSPLPTPDLSADENMEATIPLIFPATKVSTSSTIIGNQLTVNYDQSLQIQLTDDVWTIDQGNSEPGRMVTTTASDGSDAELTINRRATRQLESTVVLQSWIQTWGLGSRRRDRVVFRVRSSEPELSLIMPADSATDASQVILAVDHRPITDKQLDPSGKLTFPLPVAPANGPREHVVEAWYTVQSEADRQGRVRFEAARMQAADRAERCYWQVVLPRNEVLVRSDPRMSLERSWRWQLFGWWRQPVFEQLDLEDWIGATHQATVPDATNQYLFTSFGTIEDLNIVIAPRSLVFFVASASALMIGLLLVYVPLLHHSTLLVLIGTLLLVTGFVYPDISIMVGQAASLGLLLGLSAFLMRRALWRKVATDPARGRVPLSDSKMADLGYLASDGSSRRTTISRTLSGHASSAGAKP